MLKLFCGSTLWPSLTFITTLMTKSTEHIIKIQFVYYTSIILTVSADAMKRCTENKFDLDHFLSLVAVVPVFWVMSCKKGPLVVQMNSMQRF